MTFAVRRVVTGHDARGKAVVRTDERLAARARAGRAGVSGCEIWSTDRMPVDLDDALEPAQRAGLVRRHSYIGSGEGTVVRITRMAPGRPKFMHRTETIDYAILLSGHCDMELDGGAVVHLAPGDIVVQRGTMHAWVNPGPEPCVFAFVLIDAKPVVAGGAALPAHYPVA